MTIMMIPQQRENDKLFSPAVMQKRREMQQIKKDIKNLRHNYTFDRAAYNELAQDIYRAKIFETNLSGDSNYRATNKDYKDPELMAFNEGNKKLKTYLKSPIKALEHELFEKKMELKEAKRDQIGDETIYDLSSLARERNKLALRLHHYGSERMVTIGKKEVAANVFASKQSFKLQQCSSLVLLKETAKSRKVVYRNACKSRFCPVCGHFTARKNSREIKASIEDKLMQMYLTPEGYRKTKCEKSCKIYDAIRQGSKIDKMQYLDDKGMQRMTHGRLVHIVLTTESLPASEVMKIKEAWRVLQKRKKQSNKTRVNLHDIWQVLPWGIWKFEATYNENTGLWHPHLHILAWMDGWGASGENGYWSRIQESWKSACQHVGIKAAVNHTDEVNGAKVQHIGAVLWFTQSDIHGKMNRAGDEIHPAVEEIAKYVVKSAEFTECSNDDALLDLMVALHGKILISGWGGFKVTQPEEMIDEEGIKEELDTEEKAALVVLRWNRTGKLYEVSARQAWSDSLMREFLHDLSNYDIKYDIILGFENFYAIGMSKDVEIGT